MSHFDSEWKLNTAWCTVLLQLGVAYSQSTPVLFQDNKFQLFYRMRKCIYHKLIQIIGPTILWLYIYGGPPLWAWRLLACLSCSGPGFYPRSGLVSWVRFFRGFPSPVRQMPGSFKPLRSPIIIWPSLSSAIIIHYGCQWPEMLTCPKTSNIHTYTHMEIFQIIAKIEGHHCLSFSGPRFDSRSGNFSWSFFRSCKTIVRKTWATNIPDYQWPS